MIKVMGEGVMKEFIPNDYYRKKFSKIFDNIIDETWETIPKPLNKECIWEDYSKSFSLMKKLKGIFNE
jgi:hypothetical protein